MRRFLVQFGCYMCGSVFRTLLPGTPCHVDPQHHVHIDEEHPVVARWWASHRAPCIEVLEERA